MQLFGNGTNHIRVVVFDLDGVVAFPWGFADYLEREHSITRLHTSEFFAGPFLNCLKGQLDVKEILPPYLSKWCWGGTVNDFLDKWLEMDDRADARLLELIQKLRLNGQRCALGTNQEKYRSHYIRHSMGFEKLFDDLFFSCEIGSIKPERLYFDAVRNILDCPASSILFIDNEQHYVDAARAAGWNAQLYLSFEGLFDDSLDFYFGSKIANLI